MLAVLCLPVLSLRRTSRFYHEVPGPGPGISVWLPGRWPVTPQMQAHRDSDPGHVTAGVTRTHWQARST
eukprot:2145591-Rhodomonas_salina.3